MAKTVRGLRQGGAKEAQGSAEYAWLAADESDGVARPWGAIAWPKGVPDAYMPEADKRKFLAGPAAGGTSIAGMGDAVKKLYQLWVECRDEIVAAFAKTHPGRRPNGWWLTEAPGDRQPHESQAAFLARHDLLLPGEVARLHNRR